MNHSRLQNYKKYYVKGLVTGLLGCRWHRYQQSTEPSRPLDLVWFWALLLTSVFIFFWFYYWILAENSVEQINWYAYSLFKTSVHVYTILLVLTCLTFIYICLLCFLALCHIGHGYQVYIHWLHRIVLATIVVACIVVCIVLDNVWNDGWQLQKVSLMITSPFLHIAALVLFTFLSWFIAGWIIDGQILCNFNKALTIGVKVFYFVVYISVMIILFVIPLLINSPCISKTGVPPRKPDLVAHKGASSIAPENTLIAFEYAANHKSIVFESDVSISFDGIPFLMHDDSLRRTTNVGNIFPDRITEAPCWFNMSDLKRLDAGSWFARDDPFGTSRSLSDSEKKLFSEQKIPTLEELLDLATRTNRSVLFDLKFSDYIKSCDGHPYEKSYAQVTVDTINNSSLPSSQMWWLYYKTINIATNFTPVSNNSTLQPGDVLKSGASRVNFGFNSLSWDQIRDYELHDVSVNIWTVDSPWLFSLYWCMGVSSVTTNKCQLFNSLEKPVWYLTSDEFRTMWIVSDAVSFVIIAAIWIVQKYRRSRTTFNVENISLQPTNVKITHPPSTMKEKLLVPGDNMADAEPASPDSNGGGVQAKVEDSDIQSQQQP